jgi:DNA-binding MarR family transcriptional regulator
MSVAKRRIVHPDRMAAANSSPSLSPSPDTTLALLRQLSRAWLGLLGDCAREAGLNQKDYLALIRIVAEDGMVPSDLRHVLGISAGSTSDLADRLEQRGLIKRVSRRQDRRSIELKATAKETRIAEQTVGDLLRMLFESVRKLDATELRPIDEFLMRVAVVIADGPVRSPSGQR